MSETKTRGPAKRWYITGTGTLIGRITGVEDEVIEIDTKDRLAIEGYVALRSRGASHADITSGKAFPDRSVPGGGTARLTDEAKWREAIAYAVAEQDTKTGFSGVSRDAKDAAIAEGRVYAGGLSKADVKDRAKLGSTMRWFAKLYGEDGPVRAKVAQTPLPVALDEAAD